MTENLPDTNVGNIEYISRHAAIIEMMDNDVDHAQGTDGREVVQILSDIPAADVVPVVHGRWEHGKCNLCGEHAPYWCLATTYHESMYCPNCGAKMDGKE